MFGALRIAAAAVACAGITIAGAGAASAEQASAPAHFTNLAALEHSFTAAPFHAHVVTPGHYRARVDGATLRASVTSTRVHCTIVDGTRAEHVAWFRACADVRYAGARPHVSARWTHNHLACACARRFGAAAFELIPATDGSSYELIVSTTD